MINGNEFENLFMNIVAFKGSLENLIAIKDSLGLFNQIWLSIIGLSKEERLKIPPAIRPHAFIDRVLPFSDCCFSEESMSPMELDPSLVLGGTFRDYPDSDDDDVTGKLNNLTDEYIKSGSWDGDLARYAKIGEFPIYVAYEGKNRVSLFRKHGKLIKAMVTVNQYPQKEKLRIVRTKPFGVYYLEFDGPVDKKSSIILFPFLTIPILVKYGVNIADGEFRLKSIFELRRAFSSLTSDLLVP